MLVAGLVVAGLVAGTAGRGTAAAPAGAARLSTYLVRFADGVDPAAQAATLARSGGRVVRVHERLFPGATLRLPERAVPALRGNPMVVAVEPDGTVRPAVIQEDPPWGLDRIDQRDLPLSGTYSHGGTSGVTVYVVDSGIRSGHSEFGGRVRSGFDGVGDGDGTSDCTGHGTHVAGTIGGRTYGVAKDVSLVSVRVFGCSGLAFVSTILAALEWVAGDHDPGEPAVVNMSLGGFANGFVDAAVETLVADGVVVVAAAGNDNNDACLTSPARAPKAITVAATDNADNRAPFSNWGSCVDVFGPGVAIPSAGIDSDESSAVGTGTSMAAPHAAGVAAVLLAGDPSRTPAQVAADLIAAAIPDRVKGAGAGSPNRLLYSPPPAPGNDDFAAAESFDVTDTPPLEGSNVGATPESGEPSHAGSPPSASVWWSFTPPSDGSIDLTTAGSTFDTVLAVYRGDSLRSLVEIAAGDDRSPGEPWSEVTAPVRAGVAYHVAVDGKGGAGGEITLGFVWRPVVPPVPGAPTGVGAVAGDRSADVTWTPPTDAPEPVVSHIVTARVGSTPVAEVSVPVPVTAATVTGLQNGVPHTFTVTAVTVGGLRATSAPSDPVVPHTVPAAPRNVTAVAGDRSAGVTWSRPGSDGGAPITSYRITVLAGTVAVRSIVVLPATTSVVTGLVNGTSYTFRVAATNAAGTGPPSSASDPVTPGPPTPAPLPSPPPPPPGNRPPVAADDRYVARAGATLSTPAPGVLANDTDPDGDRIVAVLVSAPQHGVLTLAADGSFTYTPAAGWVGLDVFRYRAIDSFGGVGEALVRVDTTAVAGRVVSRSGYWMLSSGGAVYSFGAAPYLGNGLPGAVDLEPTPAGDGYWILSRSGAVTGFGGARNLGSAPPLPPGEVAASLSVTPSGGGYWIFTSRGRVFAYGDAPWRGEMSGVRLNGPVLDSVATPSGQGYWMVASDGGIFSFGDARFFGSMGDVRLNRPVMSMAADPDGAGYWLVASDGGIFAFEARFYGSMGNVVLNRPVSGMVPGSAGYLMVAEDGGIFAFGDVEFHGSLGSAPPPDPVVAVALAP